MIENLIKATPFKNLYPYFSSIDKKTIDGVVGALATGSLLGHCAMVAGEMMQGVHRLSTAEHQKEALESTAEYVELNFDKKVSGKWELLMLNSPYLLGGAAAIVQDSRFPMVKKAIVFTQEHILTLCQAVSVALAVRQIFQRQYTGFVVAACLAAAFAARTNWIPKICGNILDESFDLANRVHIIYNGNLYERTKAWLNLADQVLRWIFANRKPNPKGALVDGINPGHLLAVVEGHGAAHAEFLHLTTWFNQWKTTLDLNAAPIKPEYDEKGNLLPLPANFTPQQLLWQLAWENTHWVEKHSSDTTRQLVNYIETGLQKIIEEVSSKRPPEWKSKLAFSVNCMENEQPDQRIGKIIRIGLGHYYCEVGAANEIDTVYGMCGGKVHTLDQDEGKAVQEALNSVREQLFNAFVYQVYKTYSVNWVLGVSYNVLDFCKIKPAMERIESVIKEKIQEISNLLDYSELEYSELDKNKRFVIDCLKYVIERLKSLIKYGLELSVLNFFLGDKMNPHVGNDLFKDLIGHRFFLHDIDKARDNLPPAHRSGPLWQALYEWGGFFTGGLNATKTLREGYTKEVLVTAVADKIQAETYWYKIPKMKQATWLSWITQKPVKLGARINQYLLEQAKLRDEWMKENPNCPDHCPAFETCDDYNHPINGLQDLAAEKDEDGIMTRMRTPYARFIAEQLLVEMEILVAEN